MSSVQAHATGHRGQKRKTLRDLAIGMFWIAGFLASVQSPDGVTMAIGFFLMTFSATFLAFRGGVRNPGTGQRPRLSLWRLLNVVAWVILGPMIAAFVKLQMIVGGSFGP